jgi:NTE family protein
MSQTWEYAIFSGAGSNGILHIGALRLVEMIIELSCGKTLTEYFKGFAGTSVGALIALMVTVGLKTQDMLEYAKVHLDDFLTCRFSMKNFVHKQAFRNNKSIFDFTHLLLPYNNITFKQLFEQTNITLSICACDLQNSYLQTFDHLQTPNVQVDRAIVASMSIPFIFPPVQIQNRLYIDGGCQINLPMHVFPISKTIAFWVRSPQTQYSTAESSIGLVSFISKTLAVLIHSTDSFIENFFLQQHTANIICLTTQVTGYLLEKHQSMYEAFSLGFQKSCQHFLSKGKKNEKLQTVVILILNNLIKLAMVQLKTKIKAELNLDDTHQVEPLQDSILE